MKSEKNATASRKLLLALRVLMLLATLVFALFFGLLTAIGWSSSLQYHGDTFQALAAVLAAAMLLIAAGAVLVLFRRDIAALVCDFLGGTTAVVVIYRAIAIAEKQGWTSTSAVFYERPVADLWAQRLYPVLLPVGLIALCALLHFFSYEAKCARAERRRRREERENAPAPSILGDGKEVKPK